MTLPTTSFCILEENPTMSIPNRLTLDAVPTTPIGEIAALPAEQLALLQQEAVDALARRGASRTGWIAASTSNTAIVPLLCAAARARIPARCGSRMAISSSLPTCRSA